MHFVSSKTLERFGIFILFVVVLLYYAIAAEVTAKFFHLPTTRGSTRVMLFVFLPSSFFLTGCLAYVTRSAIIGFAALPLYILSVTSLLLLTLI